MDCSTETTTGGHGPSGPGWTSRIPYGSAAALLAVVVLLGGCSGVVSRSDRPAAVEQRAGQSPRSATAAEQPQIAAYTPPAAPELARPQPNRAVEVLIRRAEDQQLAGDLNGASVSVERALRITPEDAALWHRLAQVRMDQSQHERVVQLAAKSNALTGPRDDSLRRDNWYLIARAKRALGDTRGAREAEQKAQTGSR